MKYLSAFRFLVIAAILVLDLSCGGGGGGGGGFIPPGGGGTGSTTGPGMTVSLQAGSYWEFFWTVESTSSAMGAGTTYSTDSGRFKVTLGSPVTIQGAQAYPLVVTGTTGTGSVNFKPRWTHLASANGVLQGSTNGSTLQTILDATKTSMTGGGFFIQFGSTESVGINTGTFTGNYNTLSSVLVSHGSTAGGCETILGYTICSDSQTSFSETEHYKSGVGPLGMKRSMGYSSSGGGFSSSHLITHVVELVGTSFTPADGSTIKQPPWNEVAPMSTARTGHVAAVYNNKIYVFGGGTTSVEIYNPATDSWSAGTAIPDNNSYKVAKTVGSLIYLIPTSAVPVRIYNPVAGTWSAGQSMIMLTGDPSLDGDVWSDASGTYIVVATPNGASSGQMQVYAYRPSDDSLWYGNSLTPYTDHRWGAMTVVGNNLYVVGGYRQYLSPNYVYGNTLKYDAVADAWTTGVGALNAPRYMARAVTYNGEAVVLGGQTVVKELRDVEAYSETTHTWRTLPSMLKARSGFAAVVLNNKIYAIGGTNGGNTLANVEVYSPN